MKPELAALLADLKIYFATYQKALKEDTVIAAQTEHYQELRKLLPLLQNAISSIDEKRIDAPIGFNELYNKKFTYLNEFTKIAQGSVKHILAYQKLAQKMRLLTFMFVQKRRPL
jgi:hypothetical protein